MRPFEKQKRISDKGQAPRKSGPALLDYVYCEIKPPASPVRSLTFILKSEKKDPGICAGVQSILGGKLRAAKFYRAETVSRSGIDAATEA